jgi:hypothetical protein
VDTLFNFKPVERFKYRSDMREFRSVGEHVEQNLEQTENASRKMYTDLRVVNCSSQA